jgi:arylsulfatase A
MLNRYQTGGMSMHHRKPNIILINCDDLGYSDLGCYGSKVHKTPVLDRLAQQGAKFTSFYMASPVCTPSRGAMMTGCYPKRIGFGDFEGNWVLFPGQGLGLNPTEHTLAKSLKQQDYATMIIGKWHCGDQPEFLPTRHGFDQYYGIPYSNDMGRQVGVGPFPPLPLLLNEEVLQIQPDQTSITERYIEQSVRFIRENKNQPFFLYLAHMYVHVPLYVPNRFLNQSQNGSYGAAVECVDWATGVIMDELVRQGIDQNTLVIFTSDNGSRNDTGVSNSPLRGQKGTTWEAGMRVPCIMHWPDQIPAGTVHDEVISSIDFLPTFTAIAGGHLPDDRIIDGKDIRPLMFNEAQARSPHEAFFYYHQDRLEGVRVGKWKLHVFKTNQAIQELYDLDQDIGETKNIYDLYPDVVRMLEEQLHRMKSDLGDIVTGVPGENCREVGKVDHPQPLTRYDANHPYIIAMYDLKEFG